MKKRFYGCYDNINYQNLYHILNNLYDKISTRSFIGSASPIIGNNITRRIWADRNGTKGFGTLLIEHEQAKKFSSFEFKFSDSYYEKRFIEIKVDCDKKSLELILSDDNRKPIIEDGFNKIKEAFNFKDLKEDSDIFIVHGHDESTKNSVENFINNDLELNSIILHKEADEGRTIIEKLEMHSNVGFAIVLFTPDDFGFPKNNPKKIGERARQNVIFELGYFIAKLGRNRVCVLYKGDVEILSDFQGVLYKKMDENGSWETELKKEIQNVGILYNE